MAPRPRKTARPHWADLPAERLLDVRLSDLRLGIEGTALEGRLESLERELERAGLRFRPYTWLSTDWFTPDGATGFAIPFFLAHPRLARLERAQMLEVEGGDRDSCMRLLRHEAAHALDNAYGLHRRQRWRRAFGKFSVPYRMSYVPDPTSRRFVLNLDHWYSQSHPAEDWAETFAVWLWPGARWRKRYAGWPKALAKLQAVDEMMAEIADRPPRLRTRHRLEPLSRQHRTLREYYARKKAHYSEERAPVSYHQLEQVFARDARRTETAAAFLRKNRHQLVRRVAASTGQHRYLIDHVLRDVIQRCKERRLRLARSERESRIDAAVLLTVLTMSFLHGGHPRYRR